MWISSMLRGIFRFFAAWSRLNKAHPLVSAFSAFVVLPCVLLGGTILCIELSEAYDEFKFNHLSPAEHLRLAQNACRIQQYGGTTCADPSTATSNLNKIPRAAPEYKQAHKIAEMIQLQQKAAAERQRQNLIEQEAERLRLANQTQQESFDQMERNVVGTVHNPYRCALPEAENTTKAVIDAAGQMAQDALMNQKATEKPQPKPPSPPKPSPKPKNDCKGPQGACPK